MSRTVSALVRRLPRDSWAAIHPSDTEHIFTAKGIDRDLWRHLKDGAELESKNVGEALNEVIEWYRREVVWP